MLFFLFDNRIGQNVQKARDGKSLCKRYIFTECAGSTALGGLAVVSDKSES